LKRSDSLDQHLPARNHLRELSQRRTIRASDLSGQTLQGAQYVFDRAAHL
jgi:hypothetical protein